MVALVRHVVKAYLYLWKGTHKRDLYSCERDLQRDLCQRMKVVYMADVARPISICQKRRTKDTHVFEKRPPEGAVYANKSAM